MTKQLYYEDGYMNIFEAKVTACEKAGDWYLVVLNQTAFFPEGGGQSADLGRLQELQVLDVQEKKGIIYHKVAEALPVNGNIVGIIDWTERFSRMQQHSGEHIVSGLVHQIHGYDNVGFHLGSEAVTMDFNGAISKEQLKDLEYKANQAVAENLLVDIIYPVKEELETLEYRSKIEIEGQVRIITIAGYDICACCAPHVHRTGEIGMIKLTSVQTHRGGVRISMVCGFRALQEFNKKEQNAKEISVMLSAKEDQIAEAVCRLKEENAILKSELSKLQKQMLQFKLQDIETGSALICRFEENLSGDTPREFVNLILQREVKVGAVFAGTEKQGYRYVVGSKNVDVRYIAKALNERFHGRGGGKPEMVQGSLMGEPKVIGKVIETVLAEMI